MAKAPAKTKAKGKNPRDVRGLVEVKKLWTARGPRDWLRLFQEIAPHLHWGMAGATRITARCPYHADEDPSFGLNFQGKYGHCFGCGKHVADLVELTAKLKGCSYTEALLFLNDRLGLGDAVGANIDELSRYHQVQEMKKAAAMAMREVLSELIRDNPLHLAYCRPALAYLVRGRGLPLECLHALPVGVYPKPEHAKKYIKNPNLQALYDDYFGKTNTEVFFGAVCFHYNDSPGTISRFKVRFLDRDVVQAHAGADPMTLDPDLLRTFGTKNFALLEDPFTDKLGLFGLHKYQHAMGAGDANCYLTEGEFDAMSVMAQQTVTGRYDFTLLACSGQGSQDVGFLRDYGVRTLWLLQDHPAKKGDAWALAFLKTPGNFTSKEGLKPLSVKVFQWPAGLSGSDLDDAVRQSGYDVVCDFVVRQRNFYFMDGRSWVEQRCDAEIAKAKAASDAALAELDAADENYATALTNLTGDRRRALLETVQRWFAYIQDPAEKTGFAEKYQAEEGVDITAIDAVATNLYALNTFDGVVNRIAAALEEQFAVAYYEAKPTGNTLTLWGKGRSEVARLQVCSETELDSAVETHIKKTNLRWLDALLGDNPIYLDGCNGNEMHDAKIKKRNALFLLKEAFGMMRGKAANIQDLELLGQGIHFVDLPATVKAQNQMYFVNGKKAFRGTFDTAREMLEWEEIKNSVDQGVLFNLNQAHAWSHVTDAADLYAATSVNLAKTFEDIQIILDAWKFEHMDIMKDFLAAWIMSLPIQRAIGNTSIMYVTGDKESGKSSFINGLLGGIVDHNHQIPTILESCIFSSDGTSASFYQRMDRSSLTYIMDEAEFSAEHNTEHDKRNQDLLRLFYNMPMGGLTVHRGAQNKEQQVKYVLRHPIVLAGIYLPADTVFLSRTFILYTVKDPGRRDPADYIAEFFSETQLEQLRKNITVGLLPHIPALLERRIKLRNRLAAAGSAIAMASNRFLESVLTPLTVYEFLGHDPERLYQQILVRLKDRLEAIHGQDHQSEIINACLYSNAIKIAKEDGVADFVNARHLIMSGEIQALNNSDCGVYYLQDLNWIVIVWRQCKYTVLKGTGYVRMEDANLRERVAKNKYAVAHVGRDEHRLIQKKLGLEDVKSPGSYTVIASDYLIDSFDAETGDAKVGVGDVHIEVEDPGDELYDFDPDKLETGKTPRPRKA